MILSQDQALQTVKFYAIYPLFLLCVLIISQFLDILNIFDYIDISYYIDLNFILLILKFMF